MRTGLRAVSLTVLIVGAVVLGTMALVSPSSAATTGRRCGDIAVGPGWQSKVNVRGHRSTVTVTAPTGFLIDMYCVKTGGGSSAAVLVPVNPPAAEVVIDHPTRRWVRHYVVHLVPAVVQSDQPSGPPASGVLPSGGLPSGGLTDSPPHT